ncbi:BMP family lipoprotein [Cryobacterium tepidiphilum]|uniref:BMP family ABC transporter substrate-binding protein n=1 Tax=Cryobacterium tepidiphilum TaxID=2486026 RepID=A0A3M8L9P4_9MICO|nr:BMP family ABC transporter substrate-binding protein [Cryobacterium tepidiphilum]RNE62223.1 BMP family ABC transporter substrate-binding protein [Cryobacterium tepidiphilum]
MNRQRYLAAGVVILGSLTLSACSSAASSTSDGTDVKSIAHVLAGPLGDQSFYDDAERGIDALKKDGWKAETLQADAKNPAQWKSNMQSASDGSSTFVVTGGSSIVDTLKTVAPLYPDQKYIMYDDSVSAPNVAVVLFKQNEGSFLAGVLAAEATTKTAEFPLANDKKVIGVVGGMDIPVIKDFIAGYEAGAHAVDPSIKVLTSYVGNFTDSQKGFDQAKAMIGQGADVVYQVAGGAGTGVLQAAADGKVYAIGVDSNQNALQPGHVLASMLKNVGGSIEQAVKQAADGTLKFGETTSFGLANDGVRLTFDNNENIVPKDVIDAIDSYKQKVVDGSITVPNAAG